MPKRNYRSKREWQRLIEKQAGSGLSALAFVSNKDYQQRLFIANENYCINKI